MKRFTSIMKRKGDGAEGRRGSPLSAPQGDSPEAVVVREVTAFCESGGPDSQNAGDEYLHLPYIVDAAESSPAAATEAAKTIRKFIAKENHKRAYAQYNGIMLTRILTDNPAERFTRNFDNKFVTTIKELLREGRDMSVQQILRETLDYFENEKVAGNQSLLPLVEMWRKEKSKQMGQVPGGPYGSRTLNAPPWNHQQQHQQAYFNQPRQHRPRGLPPADELAARIEEAKTTARLLLQTIQSTPQSDLLGNELVKEFADRASSSSRNIHSYMSCDNPAADEDTMLTLIETNEQLSIAMSKYQRAVLQARKALGQATPSPQPQHNPAQNTFPMPANDMYPPVPQSAPRNNHLTPASPLRQPAETFAPPPGPPPGALGAVRTSPYGAPDSGYTTTAPPVPARSHLYSQNDPAPTQAMDYGVAENPFADQAAQPEQQQQKSYSLFDKPSRSSPTEAAPRRNNDLQQQQPPPLPQPQTASGYEQPQQQYTSYNPGYHATQSYIGRQDSATNHLTMHGASAAPDIEEQEQGGVRRKPVGGGPIDESTNGMTGRMRNLEV